MQQFCEVNNSEKSSEDKKKPTAKNFHNLEGILSCTISNDWYDLKGIIGACKEKNKCPIIRNLIL